jgi:hypothetical protein
VPLILRRSSTGPTPKHGGGVLAQVTDGNVRELLVRDACIVTALSVNERGKEGDPGYFAVGGGFSGAGGEGDTGTEAYADLQVIASYPYVEPPASVNARGSIRPNAWIVKGFNNGTEDLVVRPWVTCAPGHVR